MIVHYSLRVASILAVSMVIHKTHTPPSTAMSTTTSASTKRPPAANLSNKFFEYTIPFFGMFKGAVWAIAVAEIAILLFPSLIHGVGTATPPALQEVRNSNLRATPFSLIALIALLLGGTLRFYCYHILKKFHTFHLCILEGHRLVKTGPYGFVRHPSYSTAYLIYPGMAFWYLAPGSILVEAGGLDTFVGKVMAAMFLTYLVGTCVAFLGRIVEEDRMLKNAFGAEWDKWAEMVPCVLIPGIY